MVAMASSHQSAMCQLQRVSLFLSIKGQWRGIWTQEGHQWNPPLAYIEYKRIFFFIGLAYYEGEKNIVFRFIIEL
jgi:hypothetical protein